jgi:hypothetical protein
MKHMKNLTRYGLLLLVISSVLYACQSKTDPASNSKEVAPYEVSPNSEANLKIVNEFREALMTNDSEKAKSLVADGFMSYGPSRKDSLNIEGVINYMDQRSKNRSNVDAGIIAATALRVNEGDLAGEWVHLWGNYTATVNDSGYVIDVPWHSGYLIKDNKIIFTRAWYDNLSPSLDSGLVVPVISE